MLKISVFFLALLSAAYPLMCFSQVQWFKPEILKPDEVKTAKVVLSGAVSTENTVNLMTALDELNNTYPSLKEIELYINSYGGEMEAGYMGYQAVRASRVPVKTINAGMTASAATLIYCAGNVRLMMPEASFVLHPAKSPNIQKSFVSPGDIEMMKKDVQQGNNYFKSVYATCTNIGDESLQKILFSDDNAWFVDAQQAKQLALVRGVRAGIKPTAVSYYISDSEKP